MDEDKDSSQGRVDINVIRRDRIRRKEGSEAAKERLGKGRRIQAYCFHTPDLRRV